MTAGRPAQRPPQPASATNTPARDSQPGAGSDRPSAALTELVAFWPVRDPDALNTRAGRDALILEAAHDLPNVARRARAAIAGTPGWRFCRGWEHPGAGAYDWILACRVPANPLPRPIHERTAS